MKNFRSIFIAVLIPLSALPTPAQTPPSDSRAHAAEVLDDITAGRFEAVEAQFADEVSAALPPGMLARTWEQLTAQVGDFKRAAKGASQQMQGNRIETRVCVFERATLDAVIAFTPEGRIAGLRFVPHQEPATAVTARSEKKPTTFREQPVSVAFRHWALPGTLSVPKGAGPFPLVVLVHGSGPHDQDETIGPNAPFKDLAWGLADHGVAVLRYTKRTKQYGPQSSDDPQALTVRDEVIDDARAAVALAAKQPAIDPGRIYVLGHSLGGYLAPSIAHGDSQIAGLIILAGSARPLQRIVIEQVRYLASGLPVEQAQAQIATAERDAQAIESPTLAKGQTVSLAGAKVPASYFLDLRGYDPAQVAAQLAIPILVLQGARDYQVTAADYHRWKQALAKRSNATFKLYPSFTHLFRASSSPGTGLGAPQDYDIASHVDKQVINDIASWIAAGRP